MTSRAPVDGFLSEDKALACVHCGLCLGACPTYLETGDENKSPRGRVYLMKAVQSGRLELNASVVGQIDSCLGCRACETACPSGVQYGTLLEQTREHIEQHHQRGAGDSFLRRWLIEKTFPYPNRMRWLLAPAKVAKRLGLDRWLPGRAGEALRLLPDRWSGFDLPEVSAAQGGRKGSVAFVSGCVMSVMFGLTNDASRRLLNRAGWEVLTPKAQTCCGALHAHGGQLETAREFARRNIGVFEALPVSAIIINAAGCGSTLKEYGHLLENDPAWHERAVRFSSKVRDLSEFLVGELGASLRETVRSEKVTFHDACHLAHAQKITVQPRTLVKQVAGKNYVELPEADLCCGSAGSYNLTEPEMAARLQKRKVENIKRSGARVVVTTNPGCMLQIQAGLRAEGIEIEVKHLADYLHDALSEV